MKTTEWLKTWIEDFKAYRRGEVRVAPRGTRGRIYVKRDGVNQALAPGEASVTIVHTKADGSSQTYEVK